jgi:hypothetical protein
MVDDKVNELAEHSIKIESILSRFARAASIVKARETVVSLAGALLDPPADPMDVCMQVHARCDLRTAANTFLKFPFRSACLRRELEAPATI